MSKQLDNSPFGFWRFKIPARVESFKWELRDGAFKYWHLVKTRVFLGNAFDSAWFHCFTYLHYFSTEQQNIVKKNSIIVQGTQVMNVS